MKVLIIEDDRVQLGTLDMVLPTVFPGIILETATSPEEGRRRLTEGGWDGVLLDAWFGEPPGREYAGVTLFREMDSSLRARTIVLTGVSDNAQVRRKMTELGLPEAHFFEKPYDTQRLIQVLRPLLGVRL